MRLKAAADRFDWSSVAVVLLVLVSCVSAQELLIACVPTGQRACQHDLLEVALVLMSIMVLMEQLTGLMWVEAHIKGLGCKNMMKG